MGRQMRVSLNSKVAVAGSWGASSVLAYCANLFFSPYIVEGWTAPLSYGWVFGMAPTGAAIGAAVAVAWPNHQTALVQILSATAFTFWMWRLAIPWSAWLSRLPLTAAQHYWVSAGPGEGTLGILLGVVAVLFGGRWLFGMSVQEQWSGRLRFSLRDLRYGGSIGLGLCVATLACVALTGAGRLAFEPNWAGHGVNVFSNLYEEIVTRGLLLQVALRGGGRRFAMIWTGLVFGTMHIRYTMNGLLFALVVAATTWLFAWAIPKARSLWAGWLAHQVGDPVVDSLLH
jgi:membrane protease YdiL (CAAX protease family)